MSAITLEPVYLKVTNRDDKCISISKWDAKIYLTANPEKIDKSIILPSNANKGLIISIKFKSYTYQELQDINLLLERCLQFWENTLFYSFTSQICENTQSILIQLKCKLWFSNKINKLLEDPVQGKLFDIESSYLSYFKELSIDVDIHQSKEKANRIDAIINPFNEYFSSLLISQLELRFPLVFSSIVRRRIACQEDFIGPVSYALTNSSKLVPLLVKMISDDTSASTIFQLLSERAGGYTVKPLTKE